METFNDDIKWIFIEEGRFSEADYLLTIKTNFRKLVTDIKFSTQEIMNSFILDDSIRGILGFNTDTLNEEFNLSPYLTDILSLILFS